jgi:peptidyl-prolyl cis-trans isomerase SurA
METKVWNKAIQDTVGLHKYFDENRERYQWQSRVVANIYNVEHEKALESVKGFVEQGHFSFPKYDFYSEDESLNKAQVKILSDISQLLLQNKERFLITQYDPGNTKHQYIYGMILDQLSSMGVDTTGFGTQPEASGSLQFIVYVASSSVKDLAENMNKDAPLTLQWENGRFQPGEHPLVDKVPWEKGAHVFEADNRFILVEITEVLPAGDQELDEIKGQVISDYQTLLEEEWVQELRSKYQVDIHEAELDKVYEEYYN